MKTVTAEYNGTLQIFEAVGAEEIQALLYVKSTLSTLSRGYLAKSQRSRADLELSETLAFLAETLNGVLGSEAD